ncbi:MAG: thiol oxidoreductase, partial [Acidobacteria bacterium]|nr:thiol oxidoreductase [Acidobacteriota bacterium]
MPNLTLFVLLAVGQLGEERAVPRHLSDSELFTLTELLTHGRLLFAANWTEQDGGGRPLSKGNGRPLADLTQPLTGARAFNRISGPDANSCAGCHNAPYGISGGGGDIVTNVFVLGQRFDHVTFDPADKLPTRGTLTEENTPATLQTVANLRASTGMFGAGYLEMLAREMTADLQRTRGLCKPGDTRTLKSKGISFGTITLTSTGLWDVSKVTGLPRLSLLSSGSHDPPSLVVRPWHQAANVVSLREFSNNAYNHHHGIQTVERFGAGYLEMLA